MTKPTAEEALEWLKGAAVYLKYEGGLWFVGAEEELDSYGLTPLEAIRNAMKGESDD